MQLPSNMHILYEESKFWIGIATAIIGIYRGFEWVKDIRTKDIPGIQAGVNDLKFEITSQTTSLVKATDNNTHELRELRSDIKTLTQAFIVPPKVRAARARARRKK